MNTKNSSSVSFDNLTSWMLFRALIEPGRGGTLVPNSFGGIHKMPLKFPGDSIFEKFFISGVILFQLLGLLPLIVVYRLVHPKAWSLTATMLLGGVALILWNGERIGVFGYNPNTPMQLIYGLSGFILLGITVLPFVS